jgi:Zn-dependent protease with chaperone function
LPIFVVNSNSISIMNNSNQFLGEYKSSPNISGEPVNITLNATSISYKTAHHAQWIAIPIHQIVGMHIFNQSNVVINFGDYPYQSLICRDAQFLKELKTQCHDEPIVANLFKNGKSTFVKLMLVIASIFIGLLLLAYFFLLPWMVNKAVENFSSDYEKKFGKVMFDQVKASEKWDATQTKLLNDFFDSLHFKTKYDIEILYVKKDEVNAYAMPGGYMVVYDGIIKKMKSEEELAGLLAHEFSHIQLKHTLKSTFNSIGFSALLQIIFGGFDDSVIGLLGNQTEQLRQLHYSRTLEQEADENGFKLMKAQQLDPHGMINLFERLKAESNDIIPSILSTHPLPAERIKYIQDLISNNKFEVKNNKQLEVIFEKLKGTDEYTY